MEGFPRARGGAAGARRGSGRGSIASTNDPSMASVPLVSGKPAGKVFGFGRGSGGGESSSSDVAPLMGVRQQARHSPTTQASASSDSGVTGSRHSGATRAPPKPRPQSAGDRRPPSTASGSESAGGGMDPRRSGHSVARSPGPTSASESAGADRLIGRAGSPAPHTGSSAPSKPSGSTGPGKASAINRPGWTGVQTRSDASARETFWLDVGLSSGQSAASRSPPRPVERPAQAERSAHADKGGDRSPAGGDSMTSSPTRHPPKGQPRSYRGLLEDLLHAETSADAWLEAEHEERQEVHALRGDLRKTEGLADGLHASEASLRVELQYLKTEAADLWGAHDAPLREQEDALRASVNAIALLERSTEEQRVQTRGYQAECMQLQNVDASYRHEASQDFEACTGMVQNLEHTENALQSHTVRCNESERRATELQSMCALERDRRQVFEMEVNSKRLEAQNAREELAELERRYEASTSTWWREESACCEALDTETSALHHELEHGRRALDSVAREGAKWRDQAYRSELGIRSLLGEDVRQGLTALNQRGACYAWDDPAAAKGDETREAYATGLHSAYQVRGRQKSAV